MTARMKHPFTAAAYPNEMVYIADGLRGMRRWDPLRPTSETAGIEAPTTAPTVGGINTTFNGALIVGTIYAYVRFVDRMGYVSNLSPISASFDASNSTAKTITNATNAKPIVITATAHGFTTGRHVWVEGVEGNSSANGLFIITVIDANSFSLNNSVGNGMYRGGGGTVGQGWFNMQYTNVPVPTDSKIVSRQILRNKSGSTSVFYVDIDTTDLSTTTFTSDNIDDDLITQVPLLDSNGDDLAILRFSEPPSWASVVTTYLSRLWACGQIPYTRGNVAVTYNSDSVQGIGTDFTEAMIGRKIYVTGATRSHEIEAVNETSQVVTLTSPYADNTDPFANFSVIPAFGYRNLVYFSEVNLPEAWPPTNVLEVPATPQSGELTSLVSMAPYLYVMAENQTWRILANSDPLLDGEIVPYKRRGCVNQHCWVVVEDEIYALDGAGLYAMEGGDTVSNVIQEIFLYDPRGQYRINWKASEYFHAAQFPQEETIRWFVSMSGSYTPRHAICYHYRHKRVWFEEYTSAIGASVLGTLGSGSTLGTKQHVFLGTEADTIVAAGIGTLDLVKKDQGTLQGTVTSAGLTWIQDTEATFPTSASLNTPLVITSGTGKGQIRNIVAISRNQLDVNQPWMTLPDTTSRYQIGGISWRFKSKWFRWVENPQDQENQRAVEVIYQPTQAEASLDLRIYHDQSDDPILSDDHKDAATNDGIGSDVGLPDYPIETTRARGLIRKPVNAHRESRAAGNKHIAVELRGVTNTDPMIVHEINVEGAQ